MAMGQLNIRVPDELRAGLREAARRRGVSQAILARHALEHVTRAEPDLPGPPPSLPTASDEARVELVELVAERTGPAAGGRGAGRSSEGVCRSMEWTLVKPDTCPQRAPR